jgi:hypothetical protein
MQSPWWTPVVGLVGVIIAAAIGGLAGVFGQRLTQSRTDRREEARWQRERHERREQWEREDRSRREQWEREDRARWHADRRGVYGQAIAAVEEWARNAIPWDLKPQQLNDQSDAVIEALAAATILASPEAMMQLGRIGRGVIAISANAHAAADMPPTSNGFSLAAVVGDGAKLVASRLMDVVRSDLDIESGSSDRTRDLASGLSRVRDHWVQLVAEDGGVPWYHMTSLMFDALIGPIDEDPGPRGLGARRSDRP